MLSNPLISFIPSHFCPAERGAMGIFSSAFSCPTRRKPYQPSGNRPPSTDTYTGIPLCDMTPVEFSPPTYNQAVDAPFDLLEYDECLGHHAEPSIFSPRFPELKAPGPTPAPAPEADVPQYSLLGRLWPSIKKWSNIFVLLWVTLEGLGLFASLVNAELGLLWLPISWFLFCTQRFC